ncbi:single-stranded nucleic acid binding R3H protein [Striga asiatica]|uniref:Single-stranded nucleic acid binding R3H protein n=1 Tax=Striga asiatica TaxID=4170 RepID=A0A5A7P0D9_STRAF|nr:single-stranded nucleic acid binding R3H protein [Striga asiatica]
MDVTSQSAAESDVNATAAAAASERTEAPPAYISMVDPFLVEALQNPRHRLTILRMELDIQKFLQNPDLQLFEFPHFPTSYLRLAAHRVAQHYGLQTTVQDSSADGIRILVIRKPESKFPSVSLSDVPAKESENDKLDKIKVVLKPRPKASSNDASDSGHKRSPVRSVEERKEDYDRARARIFSSSDLGDVSVQAVSDGRSLNNSSEDEVRRIVSVDGEKSIKEIGNSCASRVAIFRDREKDRTDPDYDRSYDRYVKSMPNVQSFNPAPFNMPSFIPPFVHYDSVYPQLGQMHAPQPALNYRGPLMSPYCTVGFNQTSRDPLYMQWPTQSLMYAQSYAHLRNGVFQAPTCQQPLSFDYSQTQM